MTDEILDIIIKSLYDIIIPISQNLKVNGKQNIHNMIVIKKIDIYDVSNCLTKCSNEATLNIAFKLARVVYL